MPRIRIIVEDDQGNPLPDARRAYPLEGDLDTLDGIERAVEAFKERALPEVERSLLAEAQNRFIANARGGNPRLGTLFLCLNGTERVRIKTLHGSFEFKEQRFLLPEGSSRSYLRTTGQGLVSSGLRELCLYYCNRLSFAELSKLLKRVSGERLACEQTLWNWTQEKARQVSATLCSEVAAASSLPLPAIEEAVDIYEASSKEVLVMSDAIQVKAQKPTRERTGEPKKQGKKAKKRVSTDLLLLEGRDGSFRHLSGGLDGEVGLPEVARAHLRGCADRFMVGEEVGLPNGSASTLPG
jgi:hypothetical protein